MVAVVSVVPKVVILVAAVAGVATVAAVLAVAAVSVVVVRSGGGWRCRSLVGPIGLQPMGLSTPVVAVVALEARDGHARLNVDV